MAKALAKSAEVKAFLVEPRTGVYIVGRRGKRDGEILWASPSMEAVLGHSPTGLVGRNAWGVLLAPEDVLPATEYSARMSEGDLLAWAPLLKADGSKVWVRFDALNRQGLVVIAVRPEPDQGQHYFHGVGRSGR